MASHAPLLTPPSHPFGPFLLGYVAVLHEPLKLLYAAHVPEPVRCKPHHAAHAGARVHQRPQGHGREELRPVLPFASVGEPAELGGHHLDYLLFPQLVPVSLTLSPKAPSLEVPFPVSDPAPAPVRPRIMYAAPAPVGLSFLPPPRSGGCGARILSACPSGGLALLSGALRPPLLASSPCARHRDPRGGPSCWPPSPSPPPCLRRRLSSGPAWLVRLRWWGRGQGSVGPFAPPPRPVLPLFLLARVVAAPRFPQLLESALPLSI